MFIGKISLTAYILRGLFAQNSSKQVWRNFEKLLLQMRTMITANLKDKEKGCRKSRKSRHTVQQASSALAMCFRGQGSNHLPWLQRIYISQYNKRS